MSKKLDIGRKLDVQTRKRFVELVRVGIPVRGREIGEGFLEDHYSKNWPRSIKHKISRHRERIAEEIFVDSDMHKRVDNPVLYLSNAVLMRVIGEVLVKSGLFESLEQFREAGADDIVFAKLQNHEI